MVLPCCRNQDAMRCLLCSVKVLPAHLHTILLNQFQLCTSTVLPAPGKTMAESVTQQEGIVVTYGPAYDSSPSSHIHCQCTDKGMWVCRAHWNAEVSTKNFWWMYAKAAVRGTMAACGCSNLGYVSTPAHTPCD